MTRPIITTSLPYWEPLQAFWAWHQQPGFIWLDSADNKSRYSFMCFSPFRSITCKNGLLKSDGQPLGVQDPWTWLEQELQHFQLPPQANLPPFATGVAGYFGYELYQHLENIPLAQSDPFGLPDLCLGFYENCFVWDHQEQQCWLLSSGMGAPLARDREKRALFHTERLKLLWQNEFPSPEGFFFSLNTFQPLQTKTQYLRNIQTLKTHIREGDIYQANYAQAFVAESFATSQLPALYAKLRHKAPEPYAGYLNFGEVCLLSTSPERFLEVRHRLVRTDPIKGTAKRAYDPQTDAKAQFSLINCPKEQAENIMILDLLRNDLSKVCYPHTVSTPKQCELETFSQVHHLVSQAQGFLDPNYTVIDLLRATFPGGSITGAPKIRAQELIAQLEPLQRGPYCGAFGYLSFSGDLELAITIRTLIAKPSQAHCPLHFFVGGGITHDSDPEHEYQETLHKAAGFFALAP
jgi:para-aminobenzoate synthetase component I